MPKKRKHRKKANRSSRLERQLGLKPSPMTKAVGDMTKLAVTGLVGASLIGTIGATLKNTKK